jgi:hypothetical protein
MRFFFLMFWFVLDGTRMGFHNVNQEEVGGWMPGGKSDGHESDMTMGVERFAAAIISS